MVCIGLARSWRPAALHCDCSIKKYSKRSNLKCNYLNVSYLHLFLKTEEKLAITMKVAEFAGAATGCPGRDLLLFRKLHRRTGKPTGSRWRGQDCSTSRNRLASSAKNNMPAVIFHHHARATERAGKRPSGRLAMQCAGAPTKILRFFPIRKYSAAAPPPCTRPN